MAGMMQIDVLGEEEVQAALRKAVDSLSGAQMEAALVSGGHVIRNAAVANAPRRTSTLARSIAVLEQSPTEVAIGTNLIYARIQEEGGTITPVNAQFLRFEIGGDVIFTRGPVHIPAQPYMRPAFDSHKDQAIREVADAIRSMIGAG